MADKKISELTNITGANLADADEFVVVDTSATETKAITFGELKNAFDTSTGFVRITGDTMTGDLTIPDKIIHSGDTNTAIRFPSNDTVTVETAGSERMRINSSGNVGIGTSSPSSQLHIAAGSSGMPLVASVKHLVESSGSAAIQIASGGTSNPSYIFMGVNGNSDATRIASQIGFTQITASGASDFMRFDTGGFTERMRITSSGNVGIGTSAPSQKLTISEGNFDVVRTSGTPALIVSSIQAAGYAPAFTRLNRVGAGDTATPDNSTIGQLRFDGRDADNAYTIFASIDVNIGNNASGGAPGTLSFSTASSGATATERMRIDSSGRVGIGTSSPSAKLDVAGSAYFDSTFGVGATGFLATESGPINGFYYNPSVGRLDLASDSGVIQYWNRTGSAGAVINIRYAGVGVGNISVTSTSTAYNTSSDYRLKEDVQPMVGAVDRVLALNPVNFAWKADGSRVDGFLAHEAQAVVPEAVTGEKDAVDADGKPVYQAIDQSKLVPLLTAALQEALGRIETLEAEVAALKA